MSERFPVIAGAEPWSFAGDGARAKTGILVVHGFTGNPHSTRPFGEALAEHGFRVEVIRLPGHGTHWKDMARTRYDDWREAVAQAAAALRKECDHVFIVGLSMGGTIALDVATSASSAIAGVVPVNATLLDRDGFLAKIAPILAYIIPAVPAGAAGLAENDAAKAGVDEQAYTMVPAKAAQSLLDQLPRIRTQLRGSKTPILVAYSPQDHSVPPKNSTSIPGLVGNDEIPLLRLEQSFHLATVDLDAPLLVQETVAFVERVCGT